MKEFLFTLAGGLLLFCLALSSHYSACHLIEEANRDYKVFVTIDRVMEGGIPKQYLWGKWQHRRLTECASDTNEMAPVAFFCSLAFLAMAIATLIADDPFDLHRFAFRHRWPYVRQPDKPNRSSA